MPLTLEVRFADFADFCIKRLFPYFLLVIFVRFSSLQNKKFHREHLSCLKITKWPFLITFKYYTNCIALKSFAKNDGLLLSTVKNVFPRKKWSPIWSVKTSFCQKRYGSQYDWSRENLDSAILFQSCASVPVAASALFSDVYSFILCLKMHCPLCSQHFYDFLL